MRFQITRPLSMSILWLENVLFLKICLCATPDCWVQFCRLQPKRCAQPMRQTHLHMVIMLLHTLNLILLAFTIRRLLTGTRSHSDSVLPDTVAAAAPQLTTVDDDVNGALAYVLLIDLVVVGGGLVHLVYTARTCVGAVTRGAHSMALIVRWTKCACRSHKHLSCAGVIVQYVCATITFRTDRK
jgi:hypothetical protein